jgi:hypothetical protein
VSILLHSPFHHGLPPAEVLLVAAATTLANAAHAVEDVAKGCGVAPEVFNQLLNSSSVADFDIGQVAGLLGQPVEVVNSWSEDSRSPVPQRTDLQGPRVRSANTSCFANVPCGTCVAAASLVGVAGIATCTVIYS